ncbi:MAG TPA: AI-2E family transporter [Candidatus Saccharibacteria bacterium]|nr:AI-2E family transporter [Candidatus Saccharibacteria bacterium]HMR38206.1 AI-2E family transporter [Candidatus Saccharibacteria bacterium]
MNTSSRLWTITATIAIVVTIWFLWPWLSVLVLSAMMATLFYPLFTKLRRKKGGLAAATTLIASFLVILIPLAIISFAAADQLMSLAEQAGHINTTEAPHFVSDIINNLNHIIDPITGKQPSLSEQGVIEYLRNTVPGVARGMIDVMMGILANIPALGIALLLYIFMFLEFLFKGPKMIEGLKKISPYSKHITDTYLNRIYVMTNAMVKGQLIIALLIAALSAVLLIPLGYGAYFFVLLIIFTILNFIPLGSGIVFVPLTLIAMAAGQFWLGIIMIVVFYAIGNLDPILRPKFIPKSISLSNGWTIVSTFCGIAYFGILGVVYGPIIMVLITTTWQLYIENKTPKKIKATA